MKPVIFGLAGLQLSPDERHFFAECAPAGFILFSRNIDTPDQVRALTSELKALMGQDDLPILIDQEGGPVARLRPPHWPSFPAAPRFGELYQLAPMTAIEAARCNAQAIGTELSALGINVNCMPVLDRVGPQTAEIIAARGYGASASQIAALGKACLSGLQDAGVVGVVKHMPGQGAAQEDSHQSLPVIDTSPEERAEDLEPFRLLAHAHIGMVGHALYPAWDAVYPASQSLKIVRDIIRQNIGFSGVLITDDIEMEALSGGVGARATQALEAGCDLVLHCSGALEAMGLVANAIGEANKSLATQLESVMNGTMKSRQNGDSRAMLAKVEQLMAVAR